MNNEPVAWRKLLDTGNYMYFENYFGNSEPLYTHPHSDKSVKAKTLTDEEIIDVVESVFGTFYSMMACNNSWVDFARAILRKAQEK